MDKYQYLLKGLNAQWAKDAFWVKSILSIFETNAKEPYLLRKDEKGYYFIEEEQKVYISGVTDTSKPLFRTGEMLTVGKDVIPNKPEGCYTSVGCLIMNYLLGIYPFGKRVPFLNKSFTPDDFLPYYNSKWERSRQDVTPEAPEKEGEIFTEDYLEHANLAQFLTNFMQTVVPSITERALRSNPEVAKRRDELYKEYAGKLNDPVVQALIDKELEKVDRAYMKGDESEGFLIDKKAYGNVRKRLNWHFGAGQGLDDTPPDFITRSLREGIDIKNLSAYVNDAYSGSIGRGLETQEGGVQVKEAMRAAANLKVHTSKEGITDCGSKHGRLFQLPSKIEKANNYIGYWIIQNGKSAQLTETMIQANLGKVLMFRDMAYCSSKNSGYCQKCAGPVVSRYENGIAIINSIPGSVIMNTSMKKMHSSTVSTTPWTSKLLS